MSVILDVRNDSNSESMCLDQVLCKVVKLVRVLLWRAQVLHSTTQLVMECFTEIIDCMYNPI